MSLLVGRSGAYAAFGAVSAESVTVANGTPSPATPVGQSVGRLGAVCSSKFSSLGNVPGMPPSPVTVRLTGTSTSGVAGSLLATHSRPSYLPSASPVESNVTARSVDAPGAVVPAVCETLAHGRSLGAAQPVGPAAGAKYNSSINSPPSFA